MIGCRKLIMPSSRNISGAGRIIWLTLLLMLQVPGASAEEGVRRAQALSFNCFTCHGTNGESPGQMKSLNTLPAAEIRDKLLAFKRDEGDATIMNRIAKGYSDEEIAIIAAYLAGLDSDE